MQKILKLFVITGLLLPLVNTIYIGKMITATQMQDDKNKQRKTLLLVTGGVIIVTTVNSSISSKNHNKPIKIAIENLNKENKAIDQKIMEHQENYKKVQEEQNKRLEELSEQEQKKQEEALKIMTPTSSNNKKIETSHSLPMYGMEHREMTTHRGLGINRMQVKMTEDGRTASGFPNRQQQMDKSESDLDQDQQQQ